jgi:hypothetical protein
LREKVAGFLVLGLEIEVYGFGFRVKDLSFGVEGRHGENLKPST